MVFSISAFIRSSSSTVPWVAVRSCSSLYSLLDGVFHLCLDTFQLLYSALGCRQILLQFILTSWWCFPSLPWCVLVPSQCPGSPSDLAPVYTHFLMVFSISALMRSSSVTVPWVAVRSCSSLYSLLDGIFHFCLHAFQFLDSALSRLQILLQFILTSWWCFPSLPSCVPVPPQCPGSPSDLAPVYTHFLMVFSISALMRSSSVTVPWVAFRSCSSLYSLLDGVFHLCLDAF